VIVAAGSRVALTGADAAFHARLRAAFGLAPASRALDPRGLAYCGAEYRVYPFMRIADAVRFFSAVHERWDSEQLAADFALAGLAGTFEVRRMKRAYQRTLVLALSAASLPTTLVVENAEQFDEPPARALLARAIERAPAALATFGGDAPPDEIAVYTSVAPASTFDLRAFS
jgi:hypothetical protein